MKKSETTDRNPVLGFIFIIISIIFLFITIKLYQKECSFFYDFNTLKFSGYFLTYDVAFINQLIFENFKSLIWRFLKGYALPFFFFLITGIFFLASGLDKLTKRKFDIFNFLKNEKKEKIFLAVLFIVCFISIVLIHFHILLEFPFTSDEFSYLFQADVISTGKVTARVPMFFDSLTGDNIIFNNGNWYSKYTIGWPLLLALGKIPGIPYIINPLLASASLLLIYCITKRIFSKTAGLLAVLISLLSPYFLLQAATYFPHTSSGFFTLLLIYSFLMLTRENQWKYSLLGGFSLIMLLLIRPADGGIICLGIFPWVIWTIIKSENKGKFIFKLTPILAGFCLGIASLMLVNNIQNGNPFLFSFVKNRADELWGFGNVLHTPVKGIWNVTFSILRTGFWVFPFIVVSSFFSILKKKQESIFLIIIALGFPAFYFFYYSLGIVEFGARYYYPAFLVLMPVAANGILEIFEIPTVKKRFLKENLITAYIILCSLFMMTGVYPGLFSSIQKNYAINKKIYTWLENPLNSNEKIITIIKNVPAKKTNLFIRNHLNYKNQNNISAIFFLPGKNREIINAFPNRKPYLVSFDYRKNNFSIIPYTQKDKPDVGDFVFAAINYEASAGNIDKAIEIFKNADRLYPNNLFVEYPLGVLLYKHKKYKEAAEVLEKLVQHNQNHDDAYYFWGRSLGNLGKREKALEILNMFIKKFPKSSRIPRAKEWIKYYSGN